MVHKRVKKKHRFSHPESSPLRVQTQRPSGRIHLPEGLPIVLIANRRFSVPLVTHPGGIALPPCLGNVWKA
jgi:hypothetical protein